MSASSGTTDDALPSSPEPCTTRIVLSSQPAWWRTSGTSDVVDASVVIVARQRGLRVLTSDVDDMRRLDSGLDDVVV
ncbi:MAG: hypothetical protein M3159_06625 [Actinomycetota bacterium]|nr:hypothetical protein [Actinomycetota bacterium]